MADTDVLVVGAGPTGLLLAAELARRGVDNALIDAHDSPLGWDRATIVHSRSMQIFEALGLEAAFLEAGVRSPRVILRADGRELGVMDFSEVETPYAFDLGISENVTEDIIAAYLEAHGGQVTRGARLVGLEQDGDGVTATLHRGGETSEVRAAWLVGCDGFKSATRHLARIEYPGTDIETQWAVFDAALEGWAEPVEVQVAHLDEHPVVLTPLPGDRFRIYMRPPSADGDLVEDAMAVLNRYEPDARAVDVDDPVRFDCHSRIAADYRAGRVLLAGDAAHTCTPAQGHGMNTGLQDAFNLGWKLALVARGEAKPALLDSYEPERRPVAEIVARSGEDVEASHAIRGEAARAERDAGISNTFADPEAAHHELVAACELDRAYADSPIVAGAATDGLAPGDLFPETAESLHRLAHSAGHTVMILGGPSAAAGDVERVAAELAAEFEDAPVVDSVVGRDLGAATADRLGINGIALIAVRPDRFVGLRSDGTDPQPLRDYVETLVG